MSVETVPAERWLYARLSSDATLAGLVAGRVYSYQAPESATSPFIVFNFQGGADVAGSGAVRIWMAGLYQVKAIAQADSFATLEPIANAIDAAIQNTSGVATGGVVVFCSREAPLSLVETDNGLVYRHLGGLYRLWVRSA